MFTVTPALVMRDYNKIKKAAEKLVALKRYSRAIGMISSAARLMYNFNTIHVDDDLESMLTQIGKGLHEALPEIDNMTLNQNRVVFYDYFSLDNRGLTEQYLQGLIDNNYDILYITLQNDASKMTNILAKLSAYKKAEVVMVKLEHNIKMCQKIAGEIIQFNPSKILYHTAPWDTVGFVSLYHLGDKKIERFLINLTDHAFWLGRDCCDYFIEFRSWGVNLSIDFRHIAAERLLMLPYYPIQDTSAVFQGFPFDADGKKVIVSGGSLYKIYGSNIFFGMVKNILDTYRDTIFFYLGNGDAGPLMEFIRTNHFEDRLFYSKERLDINEIIKRCYFYLGTYPMPGGLMSQFAAANHKLPVAYAKNQMYKIDELFINNDEEVFTIYNMDALYHEINKLMTDTEYYTARTDMLKNKLISKNEFATRLRSILESKYSPFKYKRYAVDVREFSSMYFDQENKHLHRYVDCFNFKENIILIILFPVYFISRCLRKLAGK